MDNKNKHIDPKDPFWEHLRDLAREYPVRTLYFSTCQENGIDERDALMFLSTVKFDDENTDKIQAMYKWRAETFIPASAMIEDGPDPGMTIDQVRGLFQVITAIADDVRGVHVGRLRPSTVIHLRDRDIRPDLVNNVSEVMSRLCRYIKHHIPWEMQGYVPAPDDPSSIMAPISPDDHIEAWIREHDPGVCLETRPGHYESAMCAVIFDETALLVSRTRAIEPPQVPASETVMDGIANAFEKWFATDDATLTYIIRHRCLPDGHNRVLYRGPAPDAVRFWKAVHMTPGEWNACFMTADRRAIKDNALGKDLYKDTDKNSGIYVPLREFGLLE